MGYLKALQFVREQKLLSYAANILHWDMETMMPAGGAEGRGETMELMSRIDHRMKTAPEYVNTVLDLDPAKATSPEEKSQIQQMKLSAMQSLAVSEELAGALAKAQVDTQNRWFEAKKKKDFSLVEKELMLMVSLVREQADCLRGFDGLKSYYQGRSRYEVLLDMYEPGFAAHDLRRLLWDLGEKTRVILPQILSKQSQQKAPPADLFALKQNEQYELGKKIAADLGYDLNRGRLDTANHPFCTTFNGEVRITTRYREEDFTDSLSSVIHETGHALYEQNLPRHMRLTPCGEAASSGIHESQSRFWENFIARSPAFCEYLSRLTRVDATALTSKMQSVKQGFIRVDADEVSYNLHIALRFSIEEEFVEGKLAVKDIPARWNAEFERLLGQRVPDDGLGCLQDVHWYVGAYGYFPTYSLGNLLAAELFLAMKEEIPSWEKQVAAGEFSAILAFLQKRVHGQGKLASSPQTIQNAIGKPLGTDALMGHFRARYL